jgi:hypothetical protein
MRETQTENEITPQMVDAGRDWQASLKASLSAVIEGENR